MPAAVSDKTDEDVRVVHVGADAQDATALTSLRTVFDHVIERCFDLVASSWTAADWKRSSCFDQDVRDPDILARKSALLH